MTVTKTYTYTGASQSLTIPSAGVSGGKIHVKLWGASSNGPRVISGGFIEGDLAVTAGDVLTFTVGGYNGFNGGGSPNGGGASDIRKNGSALSNRVAAAGGAGATGASNSGLPGDLGGLGGAGGGDIGGGTSGGSPSGGGGGTQSAGGAAGTSYSEAPDPSPGALGIGGAGGGGTGGANPGGGGGGGYYGGGGGGGGGGDGQGGGGGSSYVALLTGTVTNSQGVAAPTLDGQIVITYTAIPNAPTLNSPVDTSTLDGTVAQRFTWTASSADPSDAQSKYDFEYSANGGVSWTLLTAITPNQFRDFSAGTFASGTYQWRVRTYNAAGNPGPYSAAGHFTVGTPAAGPTITYPVSGGVVDESEHLAWSFTGQQAYQAQRVADDSGVMADPGVPANVYYDTGQVTDTSTRSIPLTFETNARYEWLRLTCQSGGLWTAWTAERVQVSYDPPDTPTGDITTDASTGRMWVVYDDTAGSSPPEYVNVYWSPDNGATVESSELLLPPSGVAIFATPASDVDYTVQIQAVSSNGTTASTAWIGVTTVVIDGGDPVSGDTLILDGGTP